ncbi:histidine phosphatase family protein [Dactylosporangium sp. NPDC051485]|uniref:histidine phosphatase family protein n=1 Tax=Dactylosporangium sp. NPDC051485 TaxID=3154846 RepID=UPI003449E644
MTELVVIRHAEAHCNVRGTIGGPRTCTGLTDLGRRQADLLADRLHRQFAGQATVVYSSPRRRTAETAEPVAERLGKPLVTIDELRDPDYGDNADGRLWKEVLDEARATGRTSDPSLPLAVGGEPWTEYVTRTERLLHKITDQHPAEVLLLVGHAETVEAIHQVLIGLPTDSRPTARLEVANTSLTQWRITPHRRTLIAHNDHHHLTCAAPHQPKAIVGRSSVRPGKSSLTG